MKIKNDSHQSINADEILIVNDDSIYNDGDKNTLCQYQDQPSNCNQLGGTRSMRRNGLYGFIWNRTGRKT